MGSLSKPKADWVLVGKVGGNTYFRETLRRVLCLRKKGTHQEGGKEKYSTGVVSRHGKGGGGGSFEMLYKGGG